MTLDRAEALGRLREKDVWDVVVIGGGATGLGSALDAAARGYRTLLLEAHDFAKGTSSRSTKLAHGGVRYLAEGQVGLVREALRERGRLMRNAPHLVHSLPFLIPAYSVWDRPYYGLGLKVYDVLAGESNLAGTRLVGRAEALRLAPTLESVGLRGGVVYHDGQFDDARLALALARSIPRHGGVALNYVAVDGFTKAVGRIDGVRGRDVETGEEFAVRARCVINATGVFADELRRMDEPRASSLIVASQGVHLVLDRAFLPGEAAVLVPKTDDGRVMFAIPWQDRVLIGTTDTPVERPALEPRALPEEVDFLLEHARRYLARAPRRGDVLSVYAGLRPLFAPSGAGGRKTARISREFATEVSDSGLITIAGGKWTTYRAMAESGVDLAARVAGLPARKCVTAELPLHGWCEHPEDNVLGRFGSDRPLVEETFGERLGWEQPIDPALPYRLAEVAWAVRKESARTVEDVLARRTRSLLLDAKASLRAAPGVAALMAELLGRDESWRDEQLRAFAQVAAGYLLNGS